MTNPSGPRVVRAPRGSALTAKSWQTEGPLRMLMNNLDPEVAEQPEELVVYGGTGKAARSWEAYDAIVRSLTNLESDETLLVQSGKPVGIFRTHEWAPRVLIANSNLVGDWATWPEFRRLEAEGLTMYGQMTAGSWIYIGTQGILQGTYETFAAIADKRFGGTLAGTLTLTGGAGGMGGAQPLAVTLNEGVVLIVDVDPSRLERRLGKGYLDEMTDDIDDAIARVTAAKTNRQALSVGLVGNAATVFAELFARGVPIDIVTDQTSAHDPLMYLPEGTDLADWHRDADNDPVGFTERARASMAKQVEAMVAFQDAGAEVFDYGNSIRAEAKLGGYERAFEFPGFVPAYIRPLFRKAKGRFGGPRSRATPQTSPPRTRQSSSCSRTTKSSAAGSPPLARRSASKGCRHGSAGSDTRSGISPVCASTKWWPRVNSPHPSPSGETISTPGRSHPRIARPRPWPMGPTPSRIGPSSTRC